MQRFCFYEVGSRNILFVIFGRAAKSGQALRFNLFVKEAQKGFSLQSFTRN